MSTSPPRSPLQRAWDYARDYTHNEPFGAAKYPLGFISGALAFAGHETDNEALYIAGYATAALALGSDMVNSCYYRPSHSSHGSSSAYSVSTPDPHHISVDMSAMDDEHRHQESLNAANIIEEEPEIDDIGAIPLLTSSFRTDHARDMDSEGGITSGYIAPNQGICISPNKAP